jgi:elongator complex protein 2
MKIKNVYTSIAVNRTPSSLDWGANGLICYAASNAIAILDTNVSEIKFHQHIFIITDIVFQYHGSCKLLKTIAVHSKRVNTVKWIANNYGENECEFISGSDDSTCIYFNMKDENCPKKIVLVGHINGVTSVDGIWTNEGLTIATAADSTIMLWRIESDFEGGASVESFQKINLKSGICFDVKLIELQDDAGLLLAFTTDDDKIKFYGENRSKCFEEIEELVGHEDWVRGLDFIKDDNGDMLLASASQDTFIRLWRISPCDSDKRRTTPRAAESIQIQEKRFALGVKKFVLSLESVLQGHEGWIYSIHWKRNNDTNALQLLSSSMDRTMIIWSFDKESDVWMETVRVGEVGGNTLGFYGGKFSWDGKSIIGHGFQGSLHMWHQNKNNDRLWEPGIVQSGHFREVTDIAWEPQGEYLLSTSMDQTSRLHSRWQRGDDQSLTYHEIARPQVHGYDMQCLAVLSRYRFASGAEEKITRTFRAPANFVENFRNLTRAHADIEGDEIANSNQRGASVPSLGLSNKIVYQEDLLNPLNEDKKFKDEYPENYFVPISMTAPPTEEYLTQNTLWPEMQKLYAHGYELYSLAANMGGTILASACKATTLEHAEIVLWNTETWKIIQRLRSHKLTVTQMKFSPNGNRLLSVSRDRRWSLFENKPEKDINVNFQLIATTDKNNGVHERIIWCCDWTHDDKFFATGSRDGKIAIWSRNEAENSESSLGQYSCCAHISLPSESFTALCYAQRHFKESNYLLAIGLETGYIHLYTFNGSSCELLTSLNQSEAHHLCVNKLQFRPSKSEFHLASCGNDNLVRIYDVSE